MHLLSFNISDIFISLSFSPESTNHPRTQTGMPPNTRLCTKLTIHFQANTPSKCCERFLSFSVKNHCIDKKVFLITWDDIYRSSILVRIYILIVQDRKAMGLGSLSPWDKEGCLCLKSLQFLVLPDCSLILDRSYSSHWQDMRPKPRQILTSSSVEFRWSDWKGCPCSQAHVSEAIYYRTKPFASSNIFFLQKIHYLLFFPSWRLPPLLQVPKRCSHVLS